MQQQPFHLVELSPWPFVVGFSCLALPVRFVSFLKRHDPRRVFIILVALAFVCFLWWRDVDREVVYGGFHTNRVQAGMKFGFFLFILSEIIFFFSFFWRFFHSSLAPDISIGAQWPPAGVVPLAAFQIPLLNTAILLLRGVSVTWSHHSLEGGIKKEARLSLAVTVALGIFFLSLQKEEYYEASFRLADGIYGSTFFLLTGFHGLHVMVGAIILRIALFRLLAFKISSNHHIGLLVSIWYWHFVDVVWLFLFICIYWWGSFWDILS